MTKAFTISAIFLALACGPSVSDEPERIGTLEYDYGYWATWGDGWATGEWYRLDRRIEFFPEANPHETWKCAILTQEAYDQLERTIAALDPSVDYSLAPGECGWSHGASSRVHLDGFAHSPFWCDSFCCRDELGWIPSTYFLAINELSDDPIEVHGQPFPVIDVDESCD